MTIFKIQYLYFLILLSVIVVGFTCFNILLQEFKYGHIKYNSPQINYNYLHYKLNTNLHSLKKNIYTQSVKPKLPVVNININEKNLNFFKEKAPDSNKEWRQAQLIDSNKNKINIQITPRGDNPDNWSFSKKSWKIKYRKNSFPGKIRKFSYELPNAAQKFFGLKFYSSYFLSKLYNLPTPQMRFVELKINGKNQGYYYEIEDIDESFLRNNNLMPVNIYKGENYYSEFKLGLDNKLFNNAGLWNKVASFNQVDFNDHSDLEFHLSQISKFENRSVSANEFFQYFPIDIWVKFILTGSGVHSTNFHNQRIFVDPWSGWAVPIIKDPDFGQSLFLEDIYLSNNSTIDRLERALYLDPHFNYKLYLYYYDYVFKRKIISKLITEILVIKEQLINSINDDFEYKYFRKKFFKNENLDKEKINSIIEEYISYLKTLENDEFFIRKLDGGWNIKYKKLNIVNSDSRPFGKIKIVFKDSIEKKEIIISLNDKKIPFNQIDSKTIILDTVLLADRVPYANYDNRFVNDFITIRPTKFSFFISNINKIDNIFVENIFTNKFEKLENVNKVSYKHSDNNYVIINNKEPKIQTLSGKLQFNKNTIFENNIIIDAGTEILLSKDASIIFKGKVLFNGEKNNPIKILRSNNANPWGTIAIVGPKSKNSKIYNTIFDGGSGDKINNFKFTGMISIHNTNNIGIENMTVQNNSNFDDMVHIVYSEGVHLSDSVFLNANADAIDIDSSKNIFIRNILINNAQNDCLDFMQTNAVISASTFNLCEDKGLSIGERSKIIINDSQITNNLVGIESKDDSIVKINNSIIKNNEIGLSAYKKNWRYGNGGSIQYNNINFGNNKLNTQIDKNSSISNNFYE